MIKIVPAPGSYISIGGVVKGGIANRVLYIDSTGAMAQSANLTFDGTTFIAPATNLGNTYGNTLNSANYFAAYDSAANGKTFGVTGINMTAGNYSPPFGVQFAATYGVFWASIGSGNLTASLDSGLSRISAGVIGVGTGAQGSFAGRLKLTSAITAAVAVGSLNASPTIGEVQTVNDALAIAAKGATISAGGSAVCQVMWNGSNWVGT